MGSEQSSAFDLSVLGRSLWHERRRGTYLLVGSVLLGAIVSLLLPVRYEARSTLSPAATDNNSLRLGSALAGLGGQLGLDIGGARTPVRFYLRLIQSYWFLAHLARTDLGGNVTVYSLIEAEPLPTDSLLPSPKMDVAVATLRKLVDVEADERADMFTVVVRMPTRAAALASCQQAIVLFTQFDTHVRRLQASENRRFVAQRTDSARARLAVIEDSVADFLNRNRTYQSSPELLLQYQRLERRVSLVQEIYVTLARNLEQARIDEVREAPLLTVVDPPHVAWRKVEPKRAKVVATFLLAGVILFIGLAWLKASAPALRVTIG